jgi:hypothetical protein
MATFFEYLDRFIDFVYSTPNPQVQTYFRDLRVKPTQSVAEDDDSKYHYEPEPSEALTTATPSSPQLPIRAEARPAFADHR